MRYKRKLTIGNLSHQIANVQILLKTEDIELKTGKAEYGFEPKWYHNLVLKYRWFRSLIKLPDIYFTDSKGKLLKSWLEGENRIWINIPYYVCHDTEDNHYIYIYSALKDLEDK